MATNYYLSSSNHGSISLGDNWTKQLPTSPPGETPISTTIDGTGDPNAGYETDYAVTNAATGESDWDGEFSGAIDISTGNNKLYVTVAIAAYTSGGALVDGPYDSDEGQFEVEIAQLYTLTWTGVTWSGVGSTHYLAMVFQWYNDNHGSVTEGVDSQATYVRAPWGGPGADEFVNRIHRGVLVGLGRGMM